MRYIYILICTITLLGLYSCEELLDKDYQNGFVAENFMQTENQAIEAVTSIYDPLNWFGYYYFGSYVLGEAMTDNVENFWGDGNNGPDIVSIHNGLWDGTNQYFVYRWNNAYTGIARANYVLDKIDDVPNISDDKLKQLKGEALFLRAFYYYSIVTGFGDVPLITKPLSVEEANGQVRASEAQVWTQIINDLVEAATLLPATYAAEEAGHATSGAANGLLSRVYLWQKEWQNAIDVANKLTGYGLVSTEDFPNMFNSLIEHSSETVFDAVHISGYGNMWNRQKAEVNLLAHIYPMVNWGDYFHPRKITADQASGDGNAYDILDYFEATDIRREGSILIPYVDSAMYGGDTRIFPDTTMQADSSYFAWRGNLINGSVYQMRKYLLPDALQWGKPDMKNSKVNHPIVRYAEIHLNKAEAYIELEQLGNAVTELREIRTRAGLTDMVDGSIPSLPSITGTVDITSLNQTQLRELVRHERRMELYFEGERWFDLKRWDALKTVLPAAGFDYDESKHKYWPIPTTELEINPGLAN